MPGTRLEAPSAELPAATLPQRTVEATTPSPPAVQVPQPPANVQGAVEDVTSGATAPVKDVTDAAGLKLP